MSKKIIENNKYNKNNSKKNTINIVIIPEEFNIKYIKLSDPRILNNRVIMNIYHDNKIINSETPWMRAPFGISKFASKKESNELNESNEPNESKWSINLSNDFDDHPNKSKIIDNYLEQWINIDELMIKHINKYSEILFNKKYSEKDIEKLSLYTPAIKCSEKYPSSMNFRIYKKKINKDIEQEDIPNIELYNEGSKDLVEIKSFQDLQKLVQSNRYVKVIFHPKIWINKEDNKIGLILILDKLMIKKIVSNRPKGYAFRGKDISEVDNNDGENDEENEENDEKNEESEEDDKFNSGNEEEEYDE